MLTPFLKWAGGKRWLVDCSELRVPLAFNNYIEPFLGGGALFFALSPNRSLLGDTNSRLIEAYCVMRDEPAELEMLLAVHAEKHSDEYYYYARKMELESEVERAAQFLYLNRTCFNGIYRENLKGQFNVPRGSKNSIFLDTDDFSAWSETLRDAEIVVSDFGDTIDRAKDGDLIFADPPYTVRHNQNGFIKYNQRIFSWNDQERLANSLMSAVKRGASFILTNADHEAIRELYADVGDIQTVARSSVIAASNVNRGNTTELLITSFADQDATGTHPIKWHIDSTTA